MAVIDKTLLGTVALDGSATDTYLFAASSQTASIQNASVRIECDTTTEVVEFDLPEIADFAGLYGNLEVIIIDTASNAGTKNITINAGGSDKINDAASLVIDLDGGSVILKVASGTIWAATNAAIAP